MRTLRPRYGSVSLLTKRFDRASNDVSDVYLMIQGTLAHAGPQLSVRRRHRCCDPYAVAVHRDLDKGMRAQTETRSHVPGRVSLTLEQECEAELVGVGR